MKSKLLLPVCSVVISAVVVVGVSVWQPHFVAGSVPDLACELVLMPGKLFASMFRENCESRSPLALSHGNRSIAFGSLLPHLAKEDGLGLILREVAEIAT